jgi:hypothetical protein
MTVTKGNRSLTTGSYAKSIADFNLQAAGGAR